MQEPGNISTKYIRISLAIAGMCISDYAQMDLVRSECQGDNIHCGQSFLHHTTCHRRCACNGSCYS
ncbi:hypothetical protein Bca4012_097840 [Brassica carinata]